MDVVDWLRDLGLEQYVAAFRENAVTADLLPDLTPQDLKEIGVTAVGHRRRLLQAIAALRADGDSYTGEAPRPYTDDTELSESTAERRQLSVMFCDLVGSTELSSRLDPEDLGPVIRAYQDCVRETMTRYGGFIALYMGDGVLIYFGWPEAREAEAERSVRAALAVASAVGDTPIRGEKLQVRIGVATGLVVVGEPIGTGDSRQQTVIGETPNRAARLQALAGPNGVLIDSATRQQIGELFECRDLGAVQLKGLPEPVQAWSVRGESAVESRFEALRAPRLTPLIGRNEELDLLLRRWREVAGGKSRVVLISGEPGIGKSRLLAALDERLQDEPCTRLRYFCSPYHQDSPLYPIIAHLEHAAGFNRNDTTLSKLGKLQALLSSSVKPDADTSLLAGLLSISTDAVLPIPNLSPRRRKERTFEVLIRRLETLATQRPVLMLVEDAHWADPSSIELLDLTIDRLMGPSILLVMTFRPEFHAPWVGRAGVSLLTLSRLDRRNVASMAMKIAPQAMSSELIEHIVTQTDGVPLFIEELTRAVVEAGLPAPGAIARLAVPDTLQASLLARLDRLPAAKAVAQIGAVIGRTFSYELIAAVAGLREPLLREGLEQLVGAGLAFRRGAPPEASYVFKHSLVRDAAYDSLLRGHRAGLHGRVVEALLQQSPDAAETQADLLGHHCAEAGFVEQAIDHWLRAGELALARSASIEAITQLEKGERSLDRLTDSATRRRKEFDLKRALAGAFVISKGPASPEAGDAFSQMRSLCQQAGASSRLGEASHGLWLFHHNRAELAASVEVAAGLLHYAKEEDDVAFEMLGHRCTAVSMLFQAKFSGASTHFAQALALRAKMPRDLFNQRLGYHWGPSDGPHTYSSWVLLLQGYIDQALAECRTGLAKARESNNPLQLAVALHHSCAFYQFLANRREVEEQCAELITLAEEQGPAHWSAVGTIFRGWSIAVSGERERGLSEMRQGLAAKQATGSELNVPYCLGLMAALSGETAKDDATLLFADALSRIERTGERWFEAELYRLKGEGLLRGSEPFFAEAEAAFQRAREIAREQGARFWELRAATSLAHLWSDQRRTEDARNLLAPVYTWFTEGFDRPDLIKARALLTSLR